MTGGTPGKDLYFMYSEQRHARHSRHPRHGLRGCKRLFRGRTRGTKGRTDPGMEERIDTHGVHNKIICYFVPKVSPFGVWTRRRRQRED